RSWPMSRIPCPPKPDMITDSRIETPFKSIHHRGTEDTEKNLASEKTKAPDKRTFVILIFPVSLLFKFLTWNPL
ncbi:MAG: hypothetical protein ACM3N7_12470, partial [Planctomycetaceae bacterium]